MMDELKRVYEAYMSKSKLDRVNRFHWTANLDYFIRRRSVK